MTQLIQPTAFATRWPFSTMALGSTLRIGPMDLKMARRGANAARVAAHRRQCKMLITQVPGLLPDEFVLEVSCVEMVDGAPKVPHDRRKRVGVTSLTIPEALRPGNRMPMRYTGGYPFQALPVGGTFAATSAEMSVEALHRMALYARCWRGVERYSVRVARHLGVPTKVVITRAL